MKISEIEVGGEYAVTDEQLRSFGDALRATVVEKRGSREITYPTAEGERAELRQGIVVRFAEPPDVPVYDRYLAEGKRFRPAPGSRQVGSRPLRETVLKSGACVLMRWDDHLLAQEERRREEQERQRLARERAEAMIADAAAKAATVSRMLDAFAQRGWAVDLGATVLDDFTPAQRFFPESGVGGALLANGWGRHDFATAIRVWCHDPGQHDPPDLELYLTWAPVQAAAQPGAIFALADSQLSFRASRESSLAAGLLAARAAANPAAAPPAPTPARKQKR